MGSSGSGNFSDYSQNPSTKKNQGGTSDENDCTKAYSVALEEVNRCDYYISNGNIPPIGTPVKIILDIRLKAVTVENNETIGLLPTSFNFLVNCLNAGISYSGEIVSSKLVPILSLNIDIAPYE